MISRQAFILFIALSILSLGAAIFFGSRLRGEVSRIGSRSIVHDDSTTSERLALINAAMHALPRSSTFEYAGGFENPFKLWSSVKSFNGNNRTPKVKAVRTTLLLKGILLKDRPLAILENGAGETFIRGIGEKVLEETIVSISNDRVTLRDHLGTYELTVKE